MTDGVNVLSACYWSKYVRAALRCGASVSAYVVVALVFVLSSRPASAQSKSIVVVAPHPDDEGLCCSGIIYNALQQGVPVNVVVVTNGDSESPYVTLGYQREAETVAGMAVLGLSSQNVIFMGYGDQSLQELYQSTSPTTVITSDAGQTQTYANQGLGGVSYHQYLTGSPGSYNRQTVLQDMEAMLQNLKPTDVYTTGLWDDHPDHQATFNFVVEALLDLKRQGVQLSTRVHETFVHAPCSGCGVPDNANYLWPGWAPGNGVMPVFNPTQPFPQPYYLNDAGPNDDPTPYLWDQIERIPVPAPMQNSNQSANLKAQVIATYVSQGGDTPNNYLLSFAKKDEFFWIRDFSTNLAGLATVSASSDSPDSGQVAASAVDGFIEGFPGYAPWEWVTNGELNGAWIKLTWPNPVTISQVVLYNRQDGYDDVLSGKLTFSDGSSVPVGQLPINGTASLVSFAPKTVSSMQFTVDNAVGQAIGLTEIQVFGELAGKTVNHPQIWQGPMASAPLQNDAYGQPLTASITDAQTTSLNVTAFDVDAQPLSYSWTSDSGTITGTGSSVTLNPPVVAAPSVVTATVVVSDGHGGTTQSSTFVTVTPSNSSGLSVSSVALNPASIASGSAGTGTVVLNGAAPQGAIISLSSSNPAIATVPQTVIVAPGSNTASFQVNTIFVASTISLTISASLGGVTQSATLTVLQPPVVVSSLTFNPVTVGGGNSTTGTVTLSGPAPAGGAVVNLTSVSPAVVAVPASVTVLAGATMATFTASTQAVTSAVSVAISTSYVGQSTTASLRVAPYVPPNLATIATITVSSENDSTQQQGVKAIDGIVDGAPGDYTKEWATVGELSGAWIQLTWVDPVTTSQVVLYDRTNLTDWITGGTLTFSDGSSVSVGTLPNDGSPLSITFPSKSITWMQFTVTAAQGENIGLAEIAVMGSVTTATAINAVTLNPTNLIGGVSSTGTVILNGVAPNGGTVVTLASSNTSAAKVPATVTVPSGAITATFPVSTSPVTALTTVSISGSFNGTQTASLTINPVGLAAISVNPAMAGGGASSPTGTVTLNGAAPPNGAVVTLTSNNTLIASVPASVTVPGGATTATFPVTTSPVNATLTAIITGNYNGTQSATLWITPVISNGGGMQQFATDNFARANGALGPNWTTLLDSSSAPAIDNQEVSSSWVHAVAQYYGGINWPADQYAQAQIVAQGNGSIGPAVRMSSTGNFYAGTVSSLGTGSANAYILIDNNQNMSVLASASGLTIQPNDYIQLSVAGTTLTLTDVTQSTTLVTVTDSTLPAGYPGFYVGGSGSILTNWSAGLTTAPLTLSTFASDNFNRPNAPNLGPNWAIGPGYYPIQIISDQIESGGQGQPPGQGHGKEYYTAVAFPGDQWSQAQVIASSNDVNGAMVRYQGTIDTHYVAFVSMLGPPGTCTVNIDRDINGVPFVLATDSTYCSVASGDYVRLQVQGSLLSYIDVTTGTLLLSTLDTQITGGSPGWSLNPRGSTPTAANWSGGGFQ